MLPPHKKTVSSQSGHLTELECGHDILVLATRLQWKLAQVLCMEWWNARMKIRWYL